jgi:hypothetical protein
LANGKSSEKKKDWGHHPDATVTRARNPSVENLKKARNRAIADRKML